MERFPEELEPLRVLPKTVDARCWNLVRLALCRLPRPIRFELQGLRGLEAVVEDHYWLCVETFNADRPVLCWTEFRNRSRNALDEPVRCSLYLMHHHSGLIMGEALESLEKALDHRLADCRGPLWGRTTETS